MVSATSLKMRRAMRLYLEGMAALNARDNLLKSNRIKNMYKSTMNQEMMLKMTLMVPPTTDQAPDNVLLIISIHCCLLNISLIFSRSIYLRMNSLTSAGMYGILSDDLA